MEKPGKMLFFKSVRCIISDRSRYEQIMLIKANITRLEELRDITQAFFDNGMSMEVDLKRVNINLENLKVQYDNAQAMMKQQLNMLEIHYGLSG